MGLDGPSEHGFQPGSHANPNGRPKGAKGLKTNMKVRERLLGKWKTHPVDKLVELANFVMIKDPKLSAEIWTNLLKYFEPTKKPVEVASEKTSPDESKAAAEETFRLLEELEANGKIIDQSMQNLPEDKTADGILPKQVE